MRVRKLIFGILLTIACMVFTASGAYAVSINIGPNVEGDIYSYLSLFGVSLAGLNLVTKLSNNCADTFKFRAIFFVEIYKWNVFPSVVLG